MVKTTVDTLGWVIGIVIGTGLIEISPLKINPWTWICKPLRKALMEPIMDELKIVNDKVDKVQSDLDDHVRVSKEDRIQASRNRILRFNDEIIAGQEHTKEHFDDMLIVIDEYQDYCHNHPKFPNSRCLLAIENIQEAYKEKSHNNSFVTIERLVINTKEN